MGKRVYVYAGKSLVAWNCREHVIIKVTKKIRGTVETGESEKGGEGEKRKKERKKDRLLDTCSVDVTFVVIIFLIIRPVHLAK